MNATATLAVATPVPARAGAGPAEIAAMIERARAAQRQLLAGGQQSLDTAAQAVAWAIMEPGRNRTLAELAVADTGLGNVPDKVRKNHRKTLGLMRDLHGVPTTGVISRDPVRGLVEIARPVGVVAAITPSTNPAATPANKVINALKCGNAVIVAPSPKGYSTCARLLDYAHAQLDRCALPTDLVQMLPAPVDKQATAELMRQADLVVATGSQSNVRMAYQSGTPAFGVGAGNVAAIVDASADLPLAAQRIARSKMFDNATSCSSENSVVIEESVYAPMLQALAAAGGVLLEAADKARLQQAMWPDGKLSHAMTARDATTLASRAGLAAIAAQQPGFLMAEEDGVGPDHPYSGEKLSPVLTVYRARDFAHAAEIVARIYAYMGAGHSVGLHTAMPERAETLACDLPVARVIVNQSHCFATGGNFDNGLPFSLSMGCGTWGRNNFSDNLNYRHYLNITRIAHPIAERIPDMNEVLGDFFERYGR